MLFDTDDVTEVKHGFRFLVLKITGCNLHDRYLMFKSNIRTVLLPGISIAIVSEGISDADLSSIEPLEATISSVGDGDSFDFICFQEVQSPPWVLIVLCVGAGSLSPVASTISINCPFRDSIPIQ